MVYTRHSKQRGCFFQRPGSKADTDGKRMLQDTIGLTTTGWVNVWYNENSTKGPIRSYFLTPKSKGKLYWRRYIGGNPLTIEQVARVALYLLGIALIVTALLLCVTLLLKELKELPLSS